MNGHQNVAFSHLIGALKSPRNLNGYWADYATIMMLGHGNKYGLFSKPNKIGKQERFLITDRHVQFLRGKTCIGIWCYANMFAEKYKLHGLFSGMIISELQEAIDLEVAATKEEIDREMEKFANRLKYSPIGVDIVRFQQVGSIDIRTHLKLTFVDADRTIRRMRLSVLL